MSEARLFTYYKDNVVSKLKEEFGYENNLQVPQLKKVVINVGVGEAVADKKRLNDIAENIAMIAGQRPVLTKARKSISNFKLREGMPIGCKVTLRKKIMYEFVDRLITLSLPRTRDFQGIPDKGFDGRGNYTFGVKEHNIFPEISSDNLTFLHGMDITFVTSANTDEEALALLKHLGMPFRKRNNA